MLVEAVSQQQVWICAANPDVVWVCLGTNSSWHPWSLWSLFHPFSTVARNNTVEVIGSEEADSHGNPWDSFELGAGMTGMRSKFKT